MNNYTEITYAASWCILIWTIIMIVGMGIAVYMAYRHEKQELEAQKEEEEYDGDKEYWRDRAKMFRDLYSEELKTQIENLTEIHELEYELAKAHDDNFYLVEKLRQYEEARERKNGIATTDSGNEQSREEFSDRGNADV